MHCKACDHQLSEKEISFNSEINEWELCSTCLDAALDAAYSQGFKTEDDEFELVDVDWDELDRYSSYSPDMFIDDSYD